MLSDSDAASIVDGIAKCSGHGPDAGFAETLYAIEPARLQAVDVELRLFGNVHDGRKAVGQVADAVMARARKFAIPRNGVGGDLRALDQRPDHVGLGNQRVDHQARVVRVDGADEAPIAGPGVHFDFDEACADAFVRSSSFAAGDAAASLANHAVVGFDERGEGGPL